MQLVILISQMIKGSKKKFLFISKKKKKNLLAAFYHLTYQHAMIQNILIFATIKLVIFILISVYDLNIFIFLLT